MRRLAKSKAMDDTDADEVSAEDSGVLTPNRRVEQSTRLRLKRVAHVSKCWPLSKIATLSDNGMIELAADKPLNPPPIHAILPTPKHGRIIPLGSGHGHTPPCSPSSHTRYSLSTRTSYWRTNSYRRVRYISYPARRNSSSRRGFPGMQEEMMHLAMEGARDGFCVVRVCSFSLTICLVTNLFPLWS